MKHGIKLRKLQRTPSHRWALLRNLVSALLHHESIKTTLPKAKETARLAEKIITLGKKGTDPARRAATAFLMPNHHYSPSSYSSSQVPPPLASSHASSSTSTDDPELFEPSTSLLPKLFNALSERYADRLGGYTRIHRFGKRQGDNAPHAILELVDGPKDLKFEMVARAVGREQAQVSTGLRDDDALSERTRRGVQKVLRFSGDEKRRAFEEKAKAWSLAEGKAANGLRRKKSSMEQRTKSEQNRSAKPFEGRRYMAGERLGGMAIAHTGLGLARGALGGRPRGKQGLDRSPRFLESSPSTARAHAQT